MNNDLKNLEKSIGISFNNIELLKESLVHRSYLNENNVTASNERLEYLGDAVLELAISEFLFKKYPENQEGDLTSFRAALVRTESIAEESKRLGIGDYIFMSSGEEQTGGRDREYILANTFEAVIGAIYLDQGYKAAENFIVENLGHKIDEIVANRSDIDAKSKLQEIAQEKVQITPTYNLVKESGPDHNKLFVMSVSVGDFELAKGEGSSKQEAERNAASRALEDWEELMKKYEGNSNS